MPKICYVSKEFRPATLTLIETCVGIIDDYQSQGFRLTLRQLYYQLVSRDVIPNKQTEYDRLGSIINDARLAGLIDWNAIEDRTRNVEINPHWAAPENGIQTIERIYRNDLWKNQPYRPEVWVEKDALEGVVETACKPLDVPYFSCRGYTSQTAMWEAAMRLKAHTVRRNGAPAQKPIIFHFGDHDPSGIDMTRDIRDRLQLFIGRGIEIRRIALNMNQVEEYEPPPNPAKQTDSRFQGYVDQYGDESWELDALEPSVIVALIRENIRGIRNQKKWEAAVLEQETGRAELKAISENYQDVVSAIEDKVEEPGLPEDEGSAQ